MEAISEAKRHIDNAKDFLRNQAKKEDGLYHDKKYVKIAGHTAYTVSCWLLMNYWEKKIKSQKKV